MADVGTQGFQQYESQHTSRTASIVIPIMLIELITGILLLTTIDQQKRTWPFLTSLGLLGVIWLSTFVIQVPLHNTLTQAFHPDVHQQLVHSNWIRTIAWTLRSMLLCIPLLTAPLEIIT
jgi:hypothetical protein